MAADDAAIIVIKKKKKGGGGDGHHGGAWKVAYADFVTAMMAFFLLMWLLSSTSEEQRTGIADYFSPRIPISETSSGGASLFGGDSAMSSETAARNGSGGESDAARKGEGEQDGVAATAPDPAKVDPFIKALAHARAELEQKKAEEREAALAAEKMAETTAENASADDNKESPAFEALTALESALAQGDVIRAAASLVALEAAIEEALPKPLLEARREVEQEAQLAAIDRAVDEKLDDAVREALADAAAQGAVETADAMAAPGASAEDFKVSDRDALEKALDDPSLSNDDRRAMVAAFEAIEAADENGELLEHLAIRVTPEGLLIEIAETAKTPLFDSGSAKPSDVMTALMNAIAPAIAELENRVAIVGHTDAKPFAAGSARSNWTLSANRADAARRLLEQAGLAPERLARISGSADRQPLSEDVFAPENRRIGLTLLRGASKRAPSPTRASEPGARPPAPAPGGTPEAAPSPNGDAAANDI